VGAPGFFVDEDALDARAEAGDEFVDDGVAAGGEVFGER